MIIITLGAGDIIIAHTITDRIGVLVLAFITDLPIIMTLGIITLGITILGIIIMVMAMVIIRPILIGDIILIITIITITTTITETEDLM